MTDLSDKSVIVTGASRGIGEAAAEAFAARGARVLLTARSTDRLGTIAERIRDTGGQAEWIACDVTRYEDMEAAVAKCIDAFGRLDILINNAGAIDPISRLADSDPTAWTAVAEANYKGVYHGLRAAIPEMISRGGGIVVNVSSGAATSPLEGWSHYCSSKAAALMLTRCADREYRDSGIRVVGLSPGTVATEMQVSIKASGINPVSELDPAVHIPPSDSAQAILWLCSPAAAEFAGKDFSIKTAEARKLAGLADRPA